MGRPSKKLARATQEDIIESARAQFLAHGFAGASISEIAKKAKVSKSLLYHHFKDKEDIWKAVKDQIIKESMGDQGTAHDFTTTTLAAFLNDFVPFRFNLYDKNPDLVTLINWQRLETTAEKISGLSTGILKTIEEKIKILQQNGKVKKDISCEIAAYLIISNAANPFLDQAYFLKEEAQKAAYLKIIIKGLQQLLSPQ